MAENRRLNLEMEHFSSSGMILTIEEQLLLKISLPLLKIENNFSYVAFWGKVFGSEGDYYIAQGRGKDYIRNKMSFYSLDGQLWRLLLPPSIEEMMNFHLVRKRFTGDPTEYHPYVDPAVRPGEFDDKCLMKEENRLSTLVTLVDIETAIAPKNAFILSPKSRVVPNDAFRGLSWENASMHKSYVHLRLSDYDGEYVPMGCPPGPDRATDFLEPISNDRPLECWSLQCDEAGEVATLRNLWWPGLTFYHLINTPNFGRIYMGFGERNDDLLFMI